MHGSEGMHGSEEMRGDEMIDAQLRDAILAEPIDTAALDARIRQQLQIQINRHRIQRGKWIAAASIAAVLLVAVGGYLFLPNRGPAVTCSDAALDHRIEVVEHQSRTWQTGVATIDALSARQGFSMRAAQSIAPAGYHVARGKLCRLGGRVFLHLVYSDGLHEFSFFLRDRAAGAALPATDLGAEHVAPVASARFTALVVTDESRAAALDIACFASARL
jgi:hypothetical protein